MSTQDKSAEQGKAAPQAQEQPETTEPRESSPANEGATRYDKVLECIARTLKLVGECVGEPRLREFIIKQSRESMERELEAPGAGESEREKSARSEVVRLLFETSDIDSTMRRDDAAQVLSAMAEAGGNEKLWRDALHLQAWCSTQMTALRVKNRFDVIAEAYPAIRRLYEIVSQVESSLPPIAFTPDEHESEPASESDSRESMIDILIELARELLNRKEDAAGFKPSLQMTVIELLVKNQGNDDALSAMVEAGRNELSREEMTEMIVKMFRQTSDLVQSKDYEGIKEALPMLQELHDKLARRAREESRLGKGGEHAA